jgi:hypothetical protein
MWRMPDNTGSPLQWLVGINISKCIPTVLPIYVCGFALNEQLEYSLEGGKYNSFVRSLFIGFGSFSINFWVASFILRDYLIQIINLFQIDHALGSLFDAFIFTMILFVYLPTSFIICMCLRHRKRKNWKENDLKLKRDLFK